MARMPILPSDRMSALAIGYDARIKEVVLGGPEITSFRVGDWLHLTKDGGSDQRVLVSREWIESIEERLIFLEGLVNCMSTDLRNLRERDNVNVHDQ